MSIQTPPIVPGSIIGADIKAVHEHVRNQIKYIYFGSRLWKEREKKGIRTHQVASFLGILPESYQRFESGQLLPDPGEMMKIAKALDIDMARLIKWANYSRASVQKFLEKDEIKVPAAKYLNDWKRVCNEFLDEYSRLYLDGLDPGDDIVKLLKGVEKDMLRIFRLPLPPMPLFLLLTTLEEKNITDGNLSLQEIRDFIIDGESLAGYVARDMEVGSFTLYTANILFFADAPSKSIPDCLNRLNYRQFCLILTIAIADCGIYDDALDLVYIQQYHEFAGLGALMALKLKPYLQRDIDFNVLYSATLMQGIGTYAFFTVLKTSLTEYDTTMKSIGGDSKAAPSSPISAVFKEYADQAFGLLNYHLHPVIAGMIAANWGYPEAVVKCLIDHHEPVECVDAVCSMLKLINFFVDINFKIIPEAELNGLLARYPQLKISEADLFKVSCDMNKMKSNLVEVSSALVEERSQEIADYNAKRLKKMSDRYKLENDESEVRTIKKSEFRFCPEFMQPLISVVYRHIFNHMNKFFIHQKGESLDDYLLRTKCFQVALPMVLHNDVNVVAQQLKLSVDQVKAILADLTKL